jgi:hypothetical protein
MIDNILTVFSIGQRVIKTLGALKKDVESFRSPNEQVPAHFAQMEALDKRTAELELLAQEQDDRLREIEKSLKDALTATEALAQRVGKIFWMAMAGCALGVSALVLSAVLFHLR